MVLQIRLQLFSVNCNEERELGKDAEFYNNVLLCVSKKIRHFIETVLLRVLVAG